MRFPSDESRRADAGQVMEVFPSWLVLWGAYTRRFWAFPCFGAPRGTIVSSPHPGELAARMKKLQQRLAEE